jgi:hypothetical protein
VVIFGIGIGEVAWDNLKALASHGYAFKADDLQNALKEFSETSRDHEVTHSREAVFMPQLKNVPISCKDNIPMRLHIKNEGWETIPSGSIIKFWAEPYLAKTSIVIDQEIPPYKAIDIDVELEVSGSASIKTLPEFIEFALYDSKLNRIYTEHDKIIIPPGNI